MTTTIKSDNDIKLSVAYGYALGRKHGGDSVNPLFFANAYENARKRWETEGNTKEFIDVELFYRRWYSALLRAERSA